MWSIFQRVDKSQRNAPELIEYISYFRCNDVDYLSIKFEPTGEFNFESSYMYFKLIYEFYALILFSTQRWCRIDAEAPCLFNRRDHSVACQRAVILGYVNEKAWVKPVQDNFLLVY